MTQRRLRRQSSVVVLAVLAASAVLPSPARGSTVLYRTDAELVAAADRVVHARVLHQRVEQPDGPSGTIYTVSTLAILEDFTGIADQTVEVWELGGVVGDFGMWVGGAVTYDVGSEVLVCLERGRFGYRSIAMGFSKFDVEPIATADGTLDGRLTRSMREIAVVGGGPALRQRERTLAEFRALTSTVRGSRPLRNRQADLMQPEYGSSEGFTFFGPSRWTEADSGTPVNWYINTSAPTPLIGGSGVSEFQTALAAWTNPTSASIVLNYAGTTNQSAAKGPWTGIPNTGTGVLTFEDPNNEISGFTLAIGGGAWYASQDHTVNGQVFHKFAYGYVIFQNAVDLSDLFRHSQNYARVLEHEIGHTIGLGHSDMGPNDIMYPSCCSEGNTPIPPNIGPDDLAAINFIYPVSAPPPPPPPPPCTYTVSPMTLAPPFFGANTSVTVTTGSTCAWTARSNASFVTVTGGASGTGNGTVMIRVAANTRTIARSGTLTIAGQTVTVSQGGGPVVGDYNGDRVADLALFRPSNGNWMLRLSSSGFASGPDLPFGLPTDKPVPGDYDGDGLIDIAVYRPSNGIWYVIFSSTGVLAQLQWGISTDVPMQADYTGDGRTDLAVWRPGNGVWFIYDLSTSTYTSRQWGVSTDIPLTGDYDGDGKADVAAFRPSNGYWYVFHSSTQTNAVYQWGISTDIPLPADYNGDGRTDIAVYRPSNGYWFVYDLNTATYGTYQWGISTDVPAPRDYDGDGRTDLAIWRESTAQWFIYYLGSNTWQAVTHGANGDKPIR